MIDYKIILQNNGNRPKSNNWKRKLSLNLKFALIPILSYRVIHDYVLCPISFYTEPFFFGGGGVREYPTKWLNRSVKIRPYPTLFYVLYLWLCYQINTRYAYFVFLADTSWMYIKRNKLTNKQTKAINNKQRTKNKTKQTNKQKTPFVYEQNLQYLYSLPNQIIFLVMYCTQQNSMLGILWGNSAGTST